MNKQEKILLGLEMFDSILSSWFSIWWIKYFSILLSEQTLSTVQITRNAASILVLYYVIKKYENPKPSIVLGCAMLSYAGLFALLVSPEAFWIISTFMGVFCFSVVRTFINSLKAQNINPLRRNCFDNRSELISSIGGMIGGFLALLYIAEDISYWTIWIISYILFDIDLWIQYVLVEKKILIYDRNFNNNE
jgi:hypothetical protein